MLPSWTRSDRLSAGAPRGTYGLAALAALAGECPLARPSAVGDRRDVRRRGEAALGHGGLQGRADDALGLGGEGQPVGRVRGARLALGLPRRPLPEREDRPLRLTADLTAQPDRLGGP